MLQKLWFCSVNQSNGLPLDATTKKYDSQVADDVWLRDTCPLNLFFINKVGLSY